MSALTKLLFKVALPYGGHSAIGLITLLYEVAMPQANDAAYDLFYSRTFPGAYTPTCFVQEIFFRLFRPRQRLGRNRQEKISISFYRTISYDSFAVKPVSKSLPQRPDDFSLCGSEIPQITNSKNTSSATCHNTSKLAWLTHIILP